MRVDSYLGFFTVLVVVSLCYSRSVSSQSNDIDNQESEIDNIRFSNKIQDVHVKPGGRGELAQIFGSVKHHRFRLHPRFRTHTQPHHRPHYRPEVEWAGEPFEERLNHEEGFLENHGKMQEEQDEIRRKSAEKILEEEKPAEETLVQQKPVEEKSVESESAEEISSEQKLAEERPAEQKPAEKKEIMATQPVIEVTTAPPAPVQAARKQGAPADTVAMRTPTSMADIYFLAIVAGCSVAGIVGLIGAGVCWYRFQKDVKAAGEVEYPAYGVTGPNKERVQSPGDRKLAQSAQMYHYQHQKQQMIALEKANGEMKHDASDEDSEEENEEGDYTVYECPGLAPTGEMEVKNPLFSEDSNNSTPPTSAGPTQGPPGVGQGEK